MNAPAAGPMPDTALSQHVLTTGTFDASYALRKFSGQGVQSTRESLHQQLLPLNRQEPKLDGPYAKELRKYLATIGTAVMPTMAAHQASAWLNAVTLKLSDLPSRCVCQAASEAVHKAFGYIAEAEQFIRLRGDELHMLQRRAIARLDAMQSELHRAAQPPVPQLENRWSGEPISDDQVHEWQRTSMGRTIVRMGLAAGFIQAHQLSEPIPEEEQRA